MNVFLNKAFQLKDYTLALRRDFHQYPELGFKEERTAKIITHELRKIGCEVTTHIAHTGVMGVINGNSSGPVTLARFDMDALPIQEETLLDFHSAVPGIMHACGHDGHIAIGLTVARILMNYHHKITGKVKLVFQPAEEGQGGAKRMIDEGILEKVDNALALHLWNELPTGTFAISPGPVMASADIFKLKIIGHGGHGAIPNLLIDPIIAAAQIVSSLQSIVSRNLSPFQSGVLSVSMIHAGDAFNVVPSTVEIGGTIRAFEESVRSTLITRINDVVSQISAAYGCRCEILIEPWTSAVVNDVHISKLVQSTAKTVFSDALYLNHFQTMASEDMSAILSKVPGCYFFVGSKNSAKGIDHPHHHPLFTFDEDAMTLAVALMTAAIVEINSFH